MAVQKLNLSTIRDLIRLHLGEQDATLSRVTDSDGSDLASLTKAINTYGNSIPAALGNLMRMEGKNLESGRLWPYFWNTPASTAAGTITVSGATLTFPTDMDKPISLYENTLKKPIHVIERADVYNRRRYKDLPPGVPKVVEINGYNTTSYAITGTLIPEPDDSYTADLTLSYYRLPAMMPDSSPTSEYPDAPPQWHELWVIGPVVALMRSDDPAYERFLNREKELLLALLHESRLM